MTNNPYTHISGLHEIHISVNPDQIHTLRWYCKDRKMKPIMASAPYGDHPNQLMISKYKNGSSPEVIEQAHNIATDMKSFGLDILRIKVEAMLHNTGCPSGDQKPLRPEDYFEFHIKILVDSFEEYNRLINVAKEYDAHVSFNVFKKELEPLVTLRLYKCTYNEAMEMKAILIEAFKTAGFTTNFEIHQEFSVYDTNQELDAGWLPSF